MTWLGQALASLLPARGFAKVRSARVDEAFEQARAARSRKIEAADETISANDRHRARIEGEAVTIRERTALQEKKWPDGRTSEIRALVKAMLSSMEPGAQSKKGERS
ncbi:hypothetical protein ADL19_19775 [Streptomyces purpurogeneiscleroticus]|nr:hypothetical protein ADL19_19775 [Streptomyces purpurogeneiscleroticus]